MRRCEELPRFEIVQIVRGLCSILAVVESRRFKAVPFFKSSRLWFFVETAARPMFGSVSLRVRVAIPVVPTIPIRLNSSTLQRLEPELALIVTVA